jgi:hypothetical protein
MSDVATVPTSVYEAAVRDMHRYKAELRKVKATLAERDAALAAAAGEVEAAARERDALKGQLASPDDKDATIAKLRGEIRDRDHRAAFEKAAKGFRGEKGETIQESAIADLFTLSGYRAEGDAPDEGALGEAIRAAVAARPFVLAPPAAVAANGTATTPAPGPAGPGLVRGAPERSTPPTRVADQIRSTFEAARGAGADPFRIA